MEKNQYIIFQLYNEEFGIDIANVQEIITPPRITFLPGAPSYVLGVIDLRGAIIPIIDLKARLGMKSSEATEEARVIVVKIENRSYGMMVDYVHEVLRLDSTQIDRSDDIYHGVDSSFISGIARFENRLIVILQLKADI